jgi:hypothetical protein
MQSVPNVNTGKPVEYSLPLGDQLIDMNSYLEKEIHFEYEGKIECVGCGKVTKKSFNQGHCYSCLMTLASCDMCIMKPELCHYDEGTCREPKFGEEFCLQDHTVYLSNTSSVKVGITRKIQQTTRWVDQGATQALAIATVPNRKASGALEVLMKNKVADKTNWRKMLKGNGDILDMKAVAKELLPQWPEGFAGKLEDVEPVEITYPVLEFPEKIKSFNLDKIPEVKGTLLGIKGQYLLLDTGVINMRKYQGYHLNWLC